MSLKVLSLFAGIGAPEKALTNIGIPFEVVGFSEIDKYAIQSYCAIHNVDPLLNLGDVSNIDYSTLSIKPDLVTGGSPCQDFSVSGKNKGSVWTCNECKTTYNPIQQHFYKRDKCIKCGSTDLDKTRSSLLVEYLRCVRELKPKYFLYENVKNILGKQHREVFELFAMELKSYGYDIFYQVLNAKDYGVPQNRERVFIIGCRGGNQSFVFPEPRPLDIRLKDVLENDVPEKYYLGDEKVQQFLSNVNNKINADKHCLGTCHPNNKLDRSTRDRVYNDENISPTMTASMYKDAPKVALDVDCYNTKTPEGTEPKIIVEGNTNPSNHNATRVLNTEGIACTVMENHGKGVQILEYKGEEVELPCVGSARGRNPENPSDRTVGAPTEQMLELNTKGTSNTITSVQKDNYVIEPKIITVGNVNPSGNGMNGNVYGTDCISSTVTTNKGEGAKILVEPIANRIGGFFDDEKGKHQAGSIWDTEGISPTLDTMQGGWRQPCILEESNVEDKSCE